MNMSNPSELEKGNLSNVTTYQAGVMQAQMHRMLQKHCDEILKPYDITKMQWLIIGTVLDSGKKGMRVTDLALQLGTTLSYLTNTINLLESKKILQRVAHPEDSRSKYVSIKPGFLPKCREIEKFLRQKLRESIYSKVSEEDFHNYMKVVYKLTKVS